MSFTYKDETFEPPLGGNLFRGFPNHPFKDEVVWIGVLVSLDHLIANMLPNMCKVMQNMES